MSTLQQITAIVGDDPREKTHPRMWVTFTHEYSPAVNKAGVVIQESDGSLAIRYSLNYRPDDPAPTPQRIANVSASEYRHFAVPENRISEAIEFARALKFVS